MQAPARIARMPRIVPGRMVSFSIRNAKMGARTGLRKKTMEDMDEDVFSMAKK